MNFIKYFLNLLINSKWKWKLPKKSDILIYDSSGVEILSKYLSEYSFEIFYNRGYYLKNEILYISVLFISILSYEFWRGKIANSYRNTFIQIVAPKLIITFIDNSPGFYELKNQFPNTKTMFIQNGWRGELGDVFERLRYSDKYFVDCMLVFNRHIAKKYKSYISGEAVVCGSLKNNFVQIKKEEKDNSVLFISQYRDTDSFSNAFVIDSQGTEYSYYQFYDSERFVLEFLDGWCIENNLSLNISSFYSESNSNELIYYSSILRSDNWKILPRVGLFSSYGYIDSCKIVVSIDSTLGYESIGRGNRTAIFSTRGLDLNNSATKFGWPGDFPEKGPFWTNQKNIEDFRSIMDFLNNTSETEWDAICRNYASELMPFDERNSIFRNKLKEFF